MKRQFTVFGILCIVLLSSGFLLGQNAKSAKDRNAEGYTPTRAEWAEIWLLAQVTRLEAVQPNDSVNFDFAILDLGEAKPELLCQLVYRDTVDPDRIGQSIQIMRRLANNAEKRFGLDVIMVESVLSLAQAGDVARYRSSTIERRQWNAHIRHFKPITKPGEK